MLTSSSSSEDKWVLLRWSSTYISVNNKLLYIPLLCVPLRWNSSRCPVWAIGLIKKTLCFWKSSVIYLLKKIYATKPIKPPTLFAPRKLTQNKPPLKIISHSRNFRVTEGREREGLLWTLSNTGWFCKPCREGHAKIKWPLVGIPHLQQQVMIWSS